MCLELTLHWVDRLRKRANRNDAANVDRPAIHVPGHASVPALETSIETGFQIATFQGPLCAEPVEGMGFFVESLDFDPAQLEGESGA
jgi:ribosome assembly protein 1